ncbi:MAG TPA: hypothetical protein VKK79_15615 [Candidatus Lokiarchaeia archaeon]|nr:hypothetical protein [Candidatus Lokiarchaeia archaeon]
MKARHWRDSAEFMLMSLIVVGASGAFIATLLWQATASPPYEAPRVTWQVPRQVLAFYYLWYSASDYWPARTADTPLLGNYDSGNVSVMRTHIQWAKVANITGFICSWWGRDQTDTNFATLLNLSETDPACHMNLTVYYETYGHSGDVIERDLQYILETYGSSPNFLKLNGTPVIFIYIPGTVPVSTWASVFSNLSDQGLHGYFIGDTNDPSYFWVFSGVHTYNPLLQVLTGNDLAAFDRQGATEAHAYQLIHCATVTPGYDDRKIRSPGYYLPRAGGTTYAQIWQAALTSGTDWVLITTFNEWWEGTQIEPSVNDSVSYLNQTCQFASQFLLT